MMMSIRRPALVLTIACALHLGGCDYFVSPEQRVERAQRQAEAANDRGAAIELQNALRSEPANIPARLMLAEVSLRLGDPQGARKELQQAVAHGAKGTEVNELSAKIRLALGEFDELAVQLDTDDQALPEPARSTYHGLAQLGSGRIDEAVTDFRRAVAADASATQARIGLADALVQQKQLSAAAAEVAKALAAEPKNPAVLSAQGRILAQQGDYKAAITALSAARNGAAGKLSIAEYNRLLVDLVDAQLAAGDLAAATTSHAELLKRVPEAPVTQLLAARLAFTRQDYGVAVAEAQKVVAALPNLVPARLLLGSALAAQGGFNQAEVQFAAAVRAAPDNVEARKLLARINLQLQRPDMALQILAPTQRGSSDAQVDALMGWATLQHGDESAGLALLERSSQAQPADRELKLSLAMAYLQAGQNDKAVELLSALPRVAGETQRDRLLLAALAASKGPQAASAEMQKLVAANPKDVSLLNLAAEFHGRQRDFERARQLLDAALAVKPTDVDTLINLSRLEIADGKTAAARAAIQKALAAEPRNATALLTHARIMLQAGDVSGAIPLLEQVRVDDAAQIEPRLLLARIYLQRGQGREADAVLGEVLARSEGVPAIANIVGLLYMDAGRFDEALTQFNAAVRGKPDEVSYSLNVARAQQALGKGAGARALLEKLAESHPESIPVQGALIADDLRDRRQEAAIARVTQLRKAHPADPTVMTLEGDVAMDSKSYPTASAAYQAAFAAKPSSSLAVRNYRARQLGKLAQPLAPLQSWLEKSPDDAAVRMVLAEAYSSSGQRQDAIEQYELAIRGERPNATALNNLAWLYYEGGDRRALETAKRAYTMAGTAPGAATAAIADTYGWILVESGQMAEGLPILEKAVADSKAHPDIRYHYAAALAKAGKRDQALRELRALSSGDQNYASAPQVRKLLAELGG